MARDAPVDPPDRRRWLYVAAVLTVAALVRVSVMFYGSLFPDEATVGLVAKHVLRGENFPVFFYRQTYMGSLNGIHLVPALFVFGPSVLLVRFNAIAWSLLFPLGIYLLGRRIFDEATGRAALASPPCRRSSSRTGAPWRSPTSRPTSSGCGSSSSPSPR